jgi:DNA-binding beta-propeller fold protein YncE
MWYLNLSLGVIVALGVAVAGVPSGTGWSAAPRPLPTWDQNPSNNISATQAAGPDWSSGGQLSIGPPGYNPSGAAYDPITGEMFVVESPSVLAVVAFDPARVARSVYIPGGECPAPVSCPEGVAFDPANNTIFVGGFPNSISVFSASSFVRVAVVRVGFEAVALAFDPATGNVYAGGGFTTYGLNSTAGDYNVSVVNGTSYRVTQIDGYPHGPLIYPAALAYDSENGDIVSEGSVGLSGWSGVEAFQPETGMVVWGDAGNASTLYSGVAIDSANGDVALPDGSVLTILNGSTGAFVGDIALGALTGAIAYDPVSNLLLVGGASSELWSLTGLSLVAAPPVATGGPPTSLVSNSTGGSTYSISSDDASLTVVARNGSSVLGVIDVGGAPSSLAYDAQSGVLYVSTDNNVTAVSPSTGEIEARIPVPGGPGQLLYVGSSNELFAASSAGNSITVISAPSNRVIASIIVPPNPSALALDPGLGAVFVTCMNLSGENASLERIAVSTLEVDGSASLGPSYPDGMTFVPAINELAVDNDPPFYYGSLNLTFVAPGNLTRAGTVPLPQGAFPGALVFDPRTGNLVVAGAGWVFNWSFPDDIVVDPSSGVVLGEVAIGPAPTGVALNPLTDQVIATSAGANAVALLGPNLTTVISSTVLSNGSVPLAAAFGEPSPDVFIADAGNDTVSVLSASADYLVSFQEEGLPPGVNWSLTFNLSIYWGNSSLESFFVPNGSYGFSVAPVGGFVPSPTRGMVDVAGFSVVLTIRFGDAFQVDFRQVGLPPGTDWGVNISDGADVTGTNDSISADVPNGSYAFSVSTPDKTYWAPGGSFTVAGSTAQIQVGFSPYLYAVTFGEGGLAPGTRWAVNFNGVTANSTSTQIDFGATNGSYVFIVEPAEGATSNLTSGSLSVHGGPISIQIGFSLRASTSWHPSPAAAALLAFLGGSAALGAGVAVLAFRHGRRSKQERPRFPRQSG